MDSLPQSETTQPTPVHRDSEKVDAFLLDLTELTFKHGIMLAQDKDDVTHVDAMDEEDKHFGFEYRTDPEGKLFRF